MDDQDTEKSATLDHNPTNVQTERKIDFHLVSFKGPDDLSDPQNWPVKRKWLMVGMMSTMTLIV